MWSNNKKVDTLVNILIFLVAINFFHYGQFILPVICLILFVDRKFTFKVNNIKVFILLCLFGIAFCLFSYKLGFYCVMGFCLPMSYYIGSNIVNPNEENIKKLIYIIAFGMASHIILNMVYSYSIKGEDLVADRKDCVRENYLYTLRSHVLTKDYSSYEINGYVFKNEKVSVDGYHELLDDGSVDYYYVNNCGYISSKYLNSEFYETGLDGSIYSDVFFRSGGDPSKVEYYEKDATNFKNNVMPDKVNALYINAEAIVSADEYIDIANSTSGINAFVVDIKDCYIDTQLAYNSPVTSKYAPSTSNIPNSYETYRENIKKLKDAGYYLIGRITAFKDDAFAYDNPQEALIYNGDLYEYGFVKWPSIYSRKMWEYNVALALEAVNEFGFNEIQFDYCRLPEDVEDVELKNTYGESRIEAITNFLRYAAEQLHNVGAYISADVFGETSGDDPNSFSAWSTSYGQFWPAISNAVDAISSMPYPDHFGAYAYGIEEPWVDVYDLMYSWGKATHHAQENTYDKAKCRTWIMAQNSDPYDIEYTPSFIADQIKGLKDAGVCDGYLTWNASSSISKYYSYTDVLN